MLGGLDSAPWSGMGEEDLAMMQLAYVRKTSIIQTGPERRPTAMEQAADQVARIVRVCLVVVVASTAHQALLAFSAHLA